MVFVDVKHHVYLLAYVSIDSVAVREDVGKTWLSCSISAWLQHRLIKYRHIHARVHTHTDARTHRDKNINKIKIKKGGERTKHRITPPPPKQQQQANNKTTTQNRIEDNLHHLPVERFHFAGNLSSLPAPASRLRFAGHRRRASVTLSELDRCFQRAYRVPRKREGAFVEMEVTA